MQKGICKKRKLFFGFIAVTSKGQIAIPAELRQELDIKKGDKLLAIKRKDNKGINLIKVGAIDNFLLKLSKN